MTGLIRSRRKNPEVQLVIYTVQSGDTLSGIAAAHGESLSAIEAANPKISDPNVISVGEKILVLKGSSWAPAISGPASVPSSSSSPASSTGSGYHIPGMSDSMAACIAFRESTNGQATSNVFEILPASGYNVAGDSLAQQEQVAGQLYAQYGGKPWSSDGCPGT